MVPSEIRLRVTVMYRPRYQSEYVWESDGRNATRSFILTSSLSSSSSMLTLLVPKYREETSMLRAF